MTIASNDRRKPYAGNGVTTVFNGPRAFSASHIQVLLIDDATGVATEQTGGDYTLTGVGRAATVVTMGVAPPAGKTLLILRTVPYTQDTDIKNQGAFLPEIHEDAFDFQVMQTQQLADGVERSFRLPEHITGVNTELPVPQGLSPLVWNADGDALENGSTTLTGDMLLRPELANPADGKGAALVATKLAAASALPRTVTDRFADQPVHLFEFVPKDEQAAILDGTSTFDCGPALAAAIAAAQDDSLSCAVVMLPKGLINTSQTFTLTSPVRLIGRGGSGAPGYSSFPTVLGTTIKYTGADTNAVLFTFNNVNYGGCGMSNLALNGNGIARRGLILDAVLGFTSDDLHVTRFTNVLVGLISSGQTTSWCQFKNLYLEGEVDGGVGSTSLWLSGGNGGGGVGANACHCTFENLHINHGGLRSGIYLGGVDNITFTMTYIFRASGTRPGVEVVHEQQGGIWFPVANTFYHLQAGAGGWVEPSGGNATYPAAVIYGYQTDNGQPLPVTNGRRLPYITNSFDIVGIKGIGKTSYGADWAGSVSATNGSTFTDVTFPGGARSSAAYLVALNSPTTVGYAIQNKTTTGFRIAWASALGSTISVDWLVLGG